MKQKKNKIENIKHIFSSAVAQETIARSIALLCHGYSKTASEPAHFVNVQEVLSFFMKYNLKPRILIVLHALLQLFTLLFLLQKENYTNADEISF